MNGSVAPPPRIGMFGGAFDPPHAAHRMLVEAALDQLPLDRLHVVPTGQAWHKARGLSDAEHRVAMAELAFADLPRVQVDRREVVRAGPSYSVDSLRELQSENPGAQLFLVLGQDQAQALTSWREWQAVLQLATLAVAQRGDQAAQPLTVPPQARCVTLQLPVSPVSATDIRARAATGQGLAHLVAAPVARYIAHHHLYQPA